MIPKYATHFSLFTRDSSRPASLEDAMRVVGSWVGSRENDNAWRIPEDESCELTFGSGSHFVMAREVVGNEERWAMRYERVDPRLEIRWITEVGISSSGTATVVSLTMGVALEKHQTLRVQRRLRPPALVRLLIAAFAARTDAELTVTSVAVSPTEVDRFVSWTGDKTRVLPLLCVSVDPYDERPLLEPDELQQNVLGLAHVVVLSKLAAHALTSRLAQLTGSQKAARTWTLHSGAVRIYWPALDITSNNASPWQHRLWLPNERLLGEDVETEIFGELAWAAVHRVREDWVDLASVAARADSERVQILKKELATKHDLERTFDSMLQAQSEKYERLKASEQEARHRDATSAAQLEQLRQVLRDREAQVHRLKGRVDELESHGQADYHLTTFGNAIRDTLERSNEEAEVLTKLRRLTRAQGWSPNPDLTSLGDGLWEYRVNVKDHWYRFFVARFSRLATIIVLHGYPKKQNKLDQAEIEVARARLRECSKPN